MFPPTRFILACVFINVISSNLDGSTSSLLFWSHLRTSSNLKIAAVVATLVVANVVNIALSST